MFEKRIAEWLTLLRPPCSIELRYQDSPVSSVDLREDSNVELLASEVEEDAAHDAQSAGRTRVYKLVAIDEQSQRFLCPFRITMTQVNHQEQWKSLADHNIELNKLLLSERKDDRKLLLDLVDSLGRQLKREQDANEKHRTQRQEYFDKLEELRSKEEERKLERERHEKNAELLERGADTVLPLLVAAAHKLTGGKMAMLPPVDTREIALRECVIAMNEKQLDAFKVMLGDRWPELQTIMSQALDGHADVMTFRKFADSLSPEMKAGIVQVLNVGQQAALQTVLEDDTQN